MFNRILVPTDFSPPSDAALEYARILAATFQSSLQVLHVIDDPNAESAYVPDGFAPPTVDVRMSLIQNTRRRLERLMNDVDRSRCHARVDAVIGVPAAAIVDYAFATQTSLIVMGTHGRTGLAHLVMGSVAEQVVRLAPCPVLTVREAAVADDILTAVTRLRIPVAV